MAKNPAAVLDPAVFEGPDEESFDTPTAHVHVVGRNVAVPDHFRERIESKLARIEKHAPTVHRFDVVLLHENNPRQGDHRQRVEITCRNGHLVARAEACEDTFYGALEAATQRLERQLRKVNRQRQVSRSGHRRPVSVGEATAELVREADADRGVDYDDVEEVLPGQIVRRKEHGGEPMTVDEALERMELVGHDFYLFRDSETGAAAVVYRRHAFDYGLLTLSNAE